MGGSGNDRAKENQGLKEAAKRGLKSLKEEGRSSYQREPEVGSSLPHWEPWLPPA